MSGEVITVSQHYFLLVLHVLHGDGVPCVGVLHVLVRAFVLLAWAHPVAAAANVFVIVPAIYVAHMLPHHILTTAKAKMRPRTWKQDSDALLDAMVVPGAFVRLQQCLQRVCFMSPLSPQGMLVLGTLTSAWALL